jgi:myo-inositol-1-phosphate synthase
MSNPSPRAEPQRPGAPAGARRVGLWLVGGRGAIATCVAYGLSGLRLGLLEPVGLCTEAPPFDRLELAGFDELVLGGHEVVRRGLDRSAQELVREGVLPSELVAASAADAAAYDARIRPGPLDEPEVGLADLDPRSARLGAAPPREQAAAIEADLAEFRREHGLGALVVVHVASTESWRDERAEWADLGAFERALDAGRAQPASIVYAYAALRSGAGYVNFTPSRGSSIPALRELALERGVPHCGNDGKTGETLLKTVLAPMFKARALRVLAWQGYNMLGNRDGAILADSAHREAKLRNKDEALRALLGDPAVHTHVGIDFVPSLGDWKTAFDLVHFEGFLGARMTLSFTWRGSDSALAAPLVIDLARLVELALRRGERGVLAATASFFKAPLGGGSHDFHAQHEALLAWARD